MKRTTLGLLASLVLLPMSSFAQTTPQAPASWTAFQQEEKAKITAFFQQIRADRESFLNVHPEVKTYLAEMQANAKARMAAWRAAHPPKRSF